MSVLGSIQNKLTSAEMKLPGAVRTLADPLGGVSPHQEQYRMQQKMNKNADDLAAQQATDATAGPTTTPMLLRAQQGGNTTSAANVLSTGDDLDAGNNLIRPARRGQARQILSGG